MFGKILIYICRYPGTPSRTMEALFLLRSFFPFKSINLTTKSRPDRERGKRYMRATRPPPACPSLEPTLCHARDGATTTIIPHTINRDSAPINTLSNWSFPCPTAPTIPESSGSAVTPANSVSERADSSAHTSVARRYAQKSVCAVSETSTPDRKNRRQMSQNR